MSKKADISLPNEFGKREVVAGNEKVTSLEGIVEGSNIPVKARRKNPSIIQLV